MTTKKTIFWTCERTAVAPNLYPGVWEYWDGTWTRYDLPNGGEDNVAELYCIKGSREENIWVAGVDSAGKIYVARKKYGGAWSRFATTVFPSATASVINLDVRNDRMVTIDCADGPIYFNGNTFVQVGSATRTMSSNSIRRVVTGNNSDRIGLFSPNALYDESSSGSWQLLGHTDYGPDIGLPINNTSCMAVARYNPAIVDSGFPTAFAYSYFLVVGRTAAREIWKRGSWSLMVKVATLADEHASVYSVPRKKINTTENHNIYYLTAKSSGGAQWVYGLFSGSAQGSETWYQVDIPGIIPTGGFYSIDDNNHLGCGTRYIFYIKNQAGTQYESLQPTSADNAQVYSDVWGYLKNEDRPAIVNPDPPVADKIHAWATGWGKDTSTGLVWGTVFEFNGLEWIERTEEFSGTSYPDSTYNGGMQAVHAITPNDIWFAYGGLAATYGYYPIKTFHYDGNFFTEITNPFSAGAHWQCHGITGIATDDVYFSCYQGGYSQSRILHWDGISISVFADNATIGNTPLKILQMPNGDLYCLGSAAYILTMYVYIKSKDTWFSENLYSYGETIYYHAGVKLQTDGESVYIATYRRIFKGLFGNWKQLHEDNTTDNCGLSVFPNGDVYWYSIAYPYTYCSTVINDVRDTLNGQSQYLQHLAIDPTAVLGSARQEHMLAAQSWLTDKYQGSAMVPAGICDQYQSFTGGNGFTAWLEDYPEVSKIACGQGGIVVGYDSVNLEWIRMNADSFTDMSTNWTSILAFALDDIWLSGGSIPVVPYDESVSLLCHFDGRNWSRIANMGGGVFQSCCLHGNTTDNVFILSRSSSAGFHYINVLHWNGTALTTVLGLSTNGWNDFTPYSDNAATKLYVLPNGAMYIIGRYVHYLPAGSTNWQHGDVSDWQHEDPSGCDWYTGNNWDVDWVMGIDYDGSDIFVAKSGQGIWKGTFGSWEKVYTFVDGETGWPTDNLLKCGSAGDIYCGANNGRLVKYDAGTATWSSTLITDGSGDKTHHSLHYIQGEISLWSALHIAGPDSLADINAETLSIKSTVPPINEGGPGDTWEPPIGFLNIFGIYIAIVAEALNWSYEIPDAAAGSAYVWPHSADDGAETLATLESSMIPYELFERAWGDGNHLSAIEFEDSDLSQAKFHDEAGLVESFIWEWKQPIKDVNILLAQAGRPSPIYANPNDALDIGTKYKDLDTGGHAIMMRKEGVNSAFLTKTDHLFRPSVPGKGFGIGEPAGVGHEIAEFHQGAFLIAEADGILYAFLNVIPNTPIHAKISDRDATFFILVTIQGVQHIITDDGEGNLISDSDIFGNPFANTLQYVTGSVALQFNKAPDAGKIFAYYDYGITKITRLADNDSNLPYLSSINNVLLPPFNHGSISEFQTPNLAQAEFAGTIQPEDFESDWQNNENHQDMFSPTDLTTATFDPVVVQNFEDFEEYWKSNQAGDATHFPPPYEAGTAGAIRSGNWTGGDNFEDFEGTWSSVQV